MTEAFAQAVDAYESGTPMLRAAIEGMRKEDLLAKPVAGMWSTQEVVLHVSDAEDAFIDRMRRIIAMDDPLLEAWHEAKFSSQLHYERQSADDAITRFEAGRRNMTIVLRSLTALQTLRAGRHSERGPQSLLDVLKFAAYHLNHHLKFIADKRSKLAEKSS